MGGRAVEAVQEVPPISGELDERCQVLLAASVERVHRCPVVPPSVGEHLRFPNPHADLPSQVQDMAMLWYGNVTDVGRWET
jgi:hypothetical protein